MYILRDELLNNVTRYTQSYQSAYGDPEPNNAVTIT